MFYSIEIIKNMGFETVSDFVEHFMNNYSNCVVRGRPDGVYVDYDFDSQSGLPNAEYHIPQPISTGQYPKRNYKLNLKEGDEE